MRSMLVPYGVANELRKNTVCPIQDHELRMRPQKVRLMMRSLSRLRRLLASRISAILLGC